MEYKALHQSFKYRSKELSDPSVTLSTLLDCGCLPCSDRKQCDGIEYKKILSEIKLVCITSLQSLYFTIHTKSC